jgi:poly(hydroxyalkanoate) depolymerase family esterase
MSGRGIAASKQEYRVLGLGQTTAKLARYRRQWEKFLSTAKASEVAGDAAPPRTTPLSEQTGFGSNSGNLRMFKYIPARLQSRPPLVVVLHGCTQTAGGYDHGTGWSTLADQAGFALLLPEQGRANNPNRCFSWFSTADAARDRGEALSIRQMIERMIIDHGIDRQRIYVTGLSAGGAMASVMLAAYPDVFAAGAIVAGLPYGCATNVQEAFDAMFQARARPAREWGDLVRAASPHAGPWPKISVWHGSADPTVKPANADEIVKQWADLHALTNVPTVAATVDGYPYRAWHGADGETVLEAYTITGMAHGVPIAAGHGDARCGQAAPFIIDAGISSTHRIAQFWGLAEDRPAMDAAADWTRRPKPAHPKAANDIVIDEEGRVLPSEVGRAVAKPGEPHRESKSGDKEGRARQRDPGAVITKALRAAGLMK